MLTTDPSDVRRDGELPVDPAGRRGWRRLRGWAAAGLACDLVAIVAGALWCLRRGMDVSFDLLNYHFIYPWLVFHGGIGQVDPEPFTNRYVNPLAEMPWYLLDQALSPRMATFAIALVAGLNLPLVRRITLRILPEHLGSSRRLLLSVAAMLLAATGAVFRTELGMSLADVIVSLPMLAALLLVLQSLRGSHPVWRLALAGVLSGVAVGAKLTMAPYTAALFLAVLVVAWRRRRWFLPLAAHVAGVAGGVALSAGWWYWDLWRLTGNPMFPYYNGIFHSPLWPDTNLRDARFGPHGLADALQYPLYMAEGTRRLLDVPLRDPRWLVLAALGALGLLVVLGRAARSRSLRFRPEPVMVMLFFVPSALAWLFQFCIARYAVTTELLVGPVLVLCLGVLTRRPVVTAGVAAALALAMVPFTDIGQFRHVPFQTTRFQVEEAPLRAIPAGSVVISDASSAPSSFLLAYLPPGVKRHVVHPWFWDTPVLERLQREQLAVAPHVFVIEGYGGIQPAGMRRVRDKLGLAITRSGCVPVQSSTQTRWLCPATWVGLGHVAGSGS
ncbi:MAG TPA: hypothetical protein VFK66_08475 [Oryzihumus sp.]|nr:hypothetical protein [Oryzihumus sp.]